MKTVPAEDVDFPGEMIEGPGARLRQARMAKGLDRSRVAAELHLGDSLIEAIERDDYEQLPGPVFVRGYLKNYARLLGIDWQPVVGAYMRQLPPDGVSPPLRNGSRIRTQMESSRLVMRVVTWLMIFLLIALVVIWWQGGLNWLTESSLTGRTVEETGAPGEEGSTLDQGEAAPTMAFPETVEPDSGTLPLDRELPVATRAVPDTDTTPAPEPTAMEGTERESPPVVLAPAAGPDLIRVEPTPTAGAVTDPSPVVAVASANEPVTDVGEPTIEFSFSGSCWLDVRDASGKNKIIGVMAKGSRRTLTGKPPFSVVLGNTRVVDVSVNGRPYDVTRHTRGNVARFKVYYPQEGVQ